MPTYEYKCTRCGEITSEFKPMSAPRRQRCPVCRCKVELLITGGLGIVFKGDGFYVNDSRGRPFRVPRGNAGPTGAEGAARRRHEPAPTASPRAGRTSASPAARAKSRSAPASGP